MASTEWTDTRRVGDIGSPAEEPSPRVIIAPIGAGILRLVLKPQSRITQADGAWARTQLLALTKGRSVAVLLEITGVDSVSREAIAFYSAASTVAAFALLGRSPVDRMIAHSLRGLAWPGCPVQYFEAEQEALTWLLEYA